LRHCLLRCVSDTFHCLINGHLALGNAVDRGVQAARELGIPRRCSLREKRFDGLRLRDQRVTAVVSLDLGLSRGMTDESLAALPVPVLVIAAGAPSVELPAQLESANLATRLPQASSRYVEIGDASHFSFLPICKPGAVALLEEDIPGDGIICGDGDNARPREVIQQQVTSLITEFLTQSANNKVEL